MPQLAAHCCTRLSCSLIRMILAQALLEYGLVSAIAGGILQVRADVEDMLQHAKPMHYGMVGLVVVALWLVMGRRS